MNPDEIDFQIHELESRIDRLRALYEQYFMGFERTEPAVPRKDVERRIHDLRKERFNNTAKRFKFQTLIQRYNTMQQYWGRICREIENGTYKRHKLKAERTIGALDNSFFDGTQKAPVVTEAETEGPRPAERGQPARDAANLALEAAELLDANADLDAELRKAMGEAEAPKPMPTGAGLLARLGKRSEEGAPAQAPLPNAPKPKTTALPLPPLGAPTKPKVEGASSPQNAAPPAPKPSPDPKPEAAPLPKAEPKEQPRIPSWRPVALTDDSSRSRSPTPRPPAEPSAKVVVRPTVPVTRASSRPPAPINDQAKDPTFPRPPLPPRPSASLAPEGARPPGPPPRPAPRIPPRPDSKRPPPRDVPSTLTEERIRTIHEGYQRARAQTNATPVTLEKLAKSLRDTEAQLIAKSNGRKVDFEVVVEAGRAMLKPKLE